MRFIRDRGEARYLPSRYHFALFRLGALLRLTTSRPQPVEGLALAVDRDQSAVEHHTVSWMLYLLTWAYVAAALAPHLHPLPALALSAVPALILLQLPLYVVGGALTVIAPRRSQRREISAAIFVLLFLASVFFVGSTGWPRFVALAALWIGGANAAAACVLWLLRGKIREMEKRYRD